MCVHLMVSVDIPTTQYYLRQLFFVLRVCMFVCVKLDCKR